jgi:hypothetical protein
MIHAMAAALGMGSGLGARALARAVAGRAERVAALSEPVARALEQAKLEVVRVALLEGKIALPDGACDALCASGLVDEQALPALTECARVVKGGGRIYLASAVGLTRRGPERHLVSALLLHAGLVDLEQRLERGVAISSGRVQR